MSVHNSQYSFSYQEYATSADLPEKDRRLLLAAREAIAKAHAPYSRFRVGAAAELENGEILTGGNQENASFPAGLCAEGSVLATSSSLFPGVAIRNLAISYHNENASSDHPVAPCGICRQQLQEFRERTGAPIRLIMGGLEGKIVVVEDASSLMPFTFKF